MNPSTAYHPLTDGQTERVNAEVEKYLRAWINKRQDDWADWLPIAEFALNNRASEVTGASPFYLNHGRDPRTEVSVPRRSRSEPAREFGERMKGAWDEASAALRVAGEIMKSKADEHRRPERDYQIGDKVWLEATNLRTDRNSRKLDDRRYGPFEVVKRVGLSAYKLKLPRSWKRVHPVFNESLLSPFHEPVAGHQARPKPPPPDIVGGEPAYEVDEILKVRKWGRGFQYLVKWSGYGREDNTWEPPGNIDNSDELLQEFYERNPDAPRPAGLKLRRATVWPRHIFPKEWFYTTGVDQSLPSEQELRLWAARNGVRA